MNDLAITLALLALPPVSQVAQEPVHNPRTSPTRLQHALFAIRGVTGPVVPVGDVDGDGVDDLVVQKRTMLALHSGRNGNDLAVLVEIVHSDWRGGPSWAVGPDVDGDGIRDVAAVIPTESGPGIALLSGKTGARIHASPAPAGRPRTVVWMEDVDGDGVGDAAFVTAESPEVVLVSGATWTEIWRAQFPAGKSPSVRLQDVGDRSNDGVDDLLLDSGSSPGQSIWISGKDGSRLDAELGETGHVTAVGDLDGDGLVDMISDSQDWEWGVGSYEVRSTANSLAWVNGLYPDRFSTYALVRSVGDIDGDGVPDVGVADANFNLRGDGEVVPEDRAIDLSKLTLAEAFAIESQPSSAFVESGCAWIVSGRTGEKIMGVWGEPGGAHSKGGGVGSDVFGVSDQDGDGWPDLAVLNRDDAFVISSGQTFRVTEDPFDWMPGRWVSRTTRNNFTRVSEETWLDAAAGLMPGVSRSYTEGEQNGGTFEYLRIERMPDSLTLIAQPSGGEAARFEATDVGLGWVVFTNPEHDFPTRISYRRTGDVLTAEVGTVHKPDALRFRWSLMKGD